MSIGRTQAETERVPRDATGTSSPNRSFERFDLSLQVLVAIGVIVCGTMLALGFYLGAHVTRTKIDNAAERSAFFMDVLLTPLLVDLERDVPLPASTVDALDEVALDLRDRSVPTVQVWWPDGTVAYSSDAGLIGRRFPSPQLDQAAAGTVVAQLEDDLTHHGMEHQLAIGVELLEVYTPLRYPDTGEVFAVGEFYLDASGLLAETGRLNLGIWLAIGLATALMLLMLGLVAARARNVVVVHRDALNDRLREAESLATENARLLDVAGRARVEAFEINEDLLHKIGSDLHDGPLQLLGLVMLRLEATAPATGDRAVASPQWAKTTELLARTAEELRDLSGGLTLPELGRLDVAQTIRLAVTRHESNTDTAVELELGPLPSAAGTPLKICVYRIVQEALNNAFWHAGGAGQRVEAAVVGEELHVTVSDRGPGMADRGHGGSGLGIAGLTRRVKAFGGTMLVGAGPDGGTRVTALVPLDAEVTSSG